MKTLSSIRNICLLFVVAVCMFRLKSHHSAVIYLSLGFPGGSVGKILVCSAEDTRDMGFDSWIRKIPQRRAWQTTPVFLPGESQGQRSLAGYSPLVAKSQTGLKWLNTAQHIFEFIHWCRYVTLAKSSGLVFFSVNWASWNQDCQENINNLRYANDTTLMAEGKEELKSLLM